ncbi:MAG: phage tail tape measure protein, partial [Proteobacteria bacterium]|nr:phage tail tape measure protein [Pseudomonadota bacterium]
NVKIGVNVSGGGGSTKANQLKAFAGGTEEFAKKIAMPLVALGAASSYVAAKFETAQQRVESFAGASAAEMAALRPQLLKLGEEMGLAPEKLAEGFFHIRSGGLQGAAALDVLRVAAKAASSGLGEMDDVAYAMTSLSHADPSEFFKNMGQAIPIATALHIKLNDVAGIVAIMTREGLSPAKGFQRITAMLDSLSKPTPQQRKVAKLLGLDMGAFRKEMSDNLMGALDDVFVRSKGNLEKIRAFFGPRRAGDAALAFFNPNAQEENRAVMEGMQNTAGTIEHAHTVAAQTVGYQWKQAMVSIEEAGIKLGDVLAPDIKGLASGLKGLAADFGNLAAPIRNLVILGGGLALTFGGLAKVAQGALAIRGALMLLPGVEAAAAGGLGAMATAA